MSGFSSQKLSKKKIIIWIIIFLILIALAIYFVNKEVKKYNGEMNLFQECEDCIYNCPISLTEDGNYTFYSNGTLVSPKGNIFLCEKDKYALESKAVIGGKGE